MSPKSFRRLLADLELTQRGVARLMDVSERKARYWAQHGVKGGPEGLLMALLARGTVTPRHLSQLREEFERITMEQQPTHTVD
jgi:hypothetical protein